MNKNLAITAIISLVLVLGIGAFFILQPKKINSLPGYNSIEGNAVVVEVKPSEVLKTYADSAGFSFNYPQDVQISKKDVVNDQVSYASLELTSSEAAGDIAVKVLDTKLKSVDDWFLENKLTTTKEIKIGGISGKEANKNNKTIAAAIDQSVLFTLEADSKNQKYWNDVYKTILSSFEFVPPQTSTPETSNNSSDDVVFEEEIVE